MTLVIDQDRQNILDAKGHVLVTGGPGSGKTTIALAKAQKSIEAGLLTGQSVLFLSFSRAVVARIVEASKQVPKELRRDLAVQTFHSFFWSILKTYGYLLGAPKKLRLLLPHDERALRNGEEEDNPTWDGERERLFREEGVVAFDLFAPQAHELLNRSTLIRHLFSSRFPLVIVDEAQDTAEDQWQSVRLLAEKSQLLCLADLDQQIYDFRPGVSAERVTQIMDALHPVRVDLQSKNHRSPNCEVVAFGNDILLNTPRGGPYKGVSRVTFDPRKGPRDSTIRSSVGIANAYVRQAIGASAENIAMLANWGRGVNIITKALTGDGVSNRIAHRVLIDEAPVLLASRVVAFLMEARRDEAAELLDVAEGLELAAAMLRSKGGVASLTQAARLTAQALDARKGKVPRVRSVGQAFIQVLRASRQHVFSGDPRRDWLDARGLLSDSGAGLWADVAAYAEQLVAFQRGQHIAGALTELWQSHGSYIWARVALDAALAQEQILGGADDLRGIHVMTLHKAKGKEFDAVIIMDDANSCPLVGREQPPYARSRKLLRVGITRARHHVLMLTDRFNPTPLLAGHRL